MAGDLNGTLSFANGYYTLINGVNGYIGSREGIGSEIIAAQGLKVSLQNPSNMLDFCNEGILDLDDSL